MEFQEKTFKNKRIVRQKQIENLTVKFIKGLTGKGPTYIKVKSLEDIIEVHMHGVLTDLEKRLLKNNQSLELLNKIHDILESEYNCEYLEEVSKIINCKVDCIHTIRDFYNDKIRMILLIK